MKLTHVDEIRRKRIIPDEVRTPGKDDAADYIESQIIEENRWPKNLTEISEECGWSRQHVANTLRDYFEEAPQNTDFTRGNGKTVVKGPQGKIAIQVPEDVHLESYLEGWVAGYIKGIE